MLLNTAAASKQEGEIKLVRQSPKIAFNLQWLSTKFSFGFLILSLKRFHRAPTIHLNRWKYLYLISVVKQFDSFVDSEK